MILVLGILEEPKITIIINQQYVLSYLKEFKKLSIQNLDKYHVGQNTSQ